MTDRNKFEQMLEHLINDESDKAKDLFHQIVVAKSREIYEQILAEDFEEIDEKKEEDDEDEEVDESKDEDESEDEDMDESFGFAEGEDDDETGDDVGGDATDDMIDDLEGEDDMGGDMDDMGGEGDLEDRVVDLEDALDELKSEFEALMSGEEGMDDMGGDDMGMDDMGMDDEEDKMSFETDNFMREYVEKVGGKDYTSYGKMGDNGANTKSIVAGKNDMGGTVANLKGGTESGPVEANKGHLKGSSVFKGNPKEDNMGNINVPGGNAGKTAFKHKEPTYPNGLGKEQSDKSAGSMLNGAPKRAK